MEAHPTLQRQLRPTAFVPHGDYTKRCVKLLQKLGDADCLVRPRRDVDTSDYLEIPVKPFVYSDTGETDSSDDEAAADSKKRQAIEVESDDDSLVFEVQQPKRRKVSTKETQFEKTQPIKTQPIKTQPKKTQPTKTQPKKTQPKKSTQSAARRVLDSGDEDLFDSDLEIDIEEEEEEPGLPPRLSEAKRQKRLNAKSKGKQSRKAAIGSDEIGDDCERDSDLLDESDSDDGADLVDFVVGDDQATSSMFDSEATSPIKPTSGRREQGQANPILCQLNSRPPKRAMEFQTCMRLLARPGCKAERKKRLKRRHQLGVGDAQDLRCWTVTIVMFNVSYKRVTGVKARLAMKWKNCSEMKAWYCIVSYTYYGSYLCGGNYKKMMN
jgi:ATP-dependent DNA helicase MPH1